MIRTEMKSQGEKVGLRDRARNGLRTLFEPRTVAYAHTETPGIGPAFSHDLENRLRTTPPFTLSLSALQGKSVNEIAGMDGTLVIPLGASANESRKIEQIEAKADRTVEVVTGGNRSLELIQDENSLARVVTAELISRPEARMRFIDGLDELTTTKRGKDPLLGGRIDPFVAEYLRFVIDRFPETGGDVKKAHTILNMGSDSEDSFADDIVDAAHFFLDQHRPEGGTYRDLFTQFVAVGDQLAKTDYVQERMSRTGSTTVADIAPELDKIDQDTKVTLLMMAMMSNAVRGVIKKPAGYAPREVMRKHLLGEEPGAVQES